MRNKAGAWRARRRPGASLDDDRHPSCAAASSRPHRGHRRADTRCEARKSWCDRGRVRARERRRKACPRKARRGDGGSGAEGGGEVIEVFHRAQDAGLPAGWGERIRCAALRPRSSATLRLAGGAPRSGVSGFDRTVLSGFDRTTTVFFTFSRPGQSSCSISRFLL